MIGALAMMPVAWGLVRHSLTIPEAAKRAAILLVALALVETVILPLIGPLLQPTTANAHESSDASARDGSS
jgi:hypothetical protein